MMSEENIESPTPPSASAVFADSLATMVNQNDVESIIQAQKHMMSRFEKTNEMLINCNALSTVRCHIASQEFKRHTQLLLDMKKDLDCIFKRIRNIKAKLSSQHAEAFEAVSQEVVPTLAEELTEEAAAAPCPKDSALPSISVTEDGKHSSSSTCSQTTSPSPTLSSSPTDST